MHSKVAFIASLYALLSNKTVLPKEMLWTENKKSHIIKKGQFINFFLRLFVYSKMHSCMLNSKSYVHNRCNIKLSHMSFPPTNRSLTLNVTCEVSHIHTYFTVSHIIPITKYEWKIIQNLKSILYVNLIKHWIENKFHDYDPKIFRYLCFFSDCPMGCEELFMPTYSQLSEFNDWNSSLFPTYVLSHSTDSNVFSELLQLAEEICDKDSTRTGKEQYLLISLLWIGFN